LHETSFYLLVLIIGVGVGIQWLADRLRLPSLLLLLAAGITLGPGTGLLDPDEFFGDLFKPLISIAVALVLFEGGLSLHIREAKFAGRALWRLIFAGLFIGVGAVTLIAHYLAGLSIATAAVLGAILVVTGPTVILPMLRSARISLRPATLLKWEGIVNDPLGAMLALFVFQAVAVWGEAGASQGILALFLSLFVHALIGSMIGAAAGLLLGLSLNRGWIAEHLKSPVILAAVLVVFAGADALREENGLLAVTVMGLVLANLKGTNIEDVRHFKEQISTLLISFLFIVLSARLDPASLSMLLGSSRSPWISPILLIALIIFVVRPVMVLVASLGTSLPWKERALIAWIAPRGVVAAAVAGAFEPRLLDQGFEDATILTPIVFGVIVATVVLHGLSLKPLSRKLGLSGVQGNGILLVGAPTWGVDLARALQKAGAYVILADTRYRRVSHARREGLEVHYGDVLSQEAALEIPLERVSWLLALTDDDSYNTLVCTHFARELERQHVLQLSPMGQGVKKEMEHHMMGQTPWDERGSYQEITSRYWRGSTFKVTPISENFGWEELKEKNPGALFLFYVNQDRVQAMSGKKEPPAGAKVIYFTDDQQKNGGDSGAGSN
jgi:NhaP-type Na+/H+ or K+/H+ antiporter